MPDELERLQNVFANLGSVVIAYSGGVDSSLLLKVAHDVLGDRAMAATAVSPSMAAVDRIEAENLARWIGTRHVLVPTVETSDPRYALNTPERCYYCRSVTYDQLIAHGRRNGFRAIVDGTNADDARDMRPGRKAARELGVLSPLLDLGLTKACTRSLARRLGLPNWDKPSAPCLASRIPYGTAITPELLSRVERSEAALRRLGLRQLRVRHHDTVARIEVAATDFETVLSGREEIVAALAAAGYTYVSLDLGGFRSGSLNEAIRSTDRD